MLLTINLLQLCTPSAQQRAAILLGDPAPLALGASPIICIIPQPHCKLLFFNTLQMPFYLSNAALLLPIHCRFSITNPLLLLYYQRTANSLLPIHYIFCF
jgi:hypothetical protein